MAGASAGAGVAGGPSAQSYVFSQQPTAVPHTRKYRDSGRQVPSKPINIMYDKRVFRGSTYSAQVLTPSAQAEAERLAQLAEDRRRRRLDARRRREAAAQAEESKAPPPVPGRRHNGSQTEQFLEELTDRPVEEEVGVQTDKWIDRPPTPPFMPPPSGVDADTQVEHGELFDFDFEVEPILEVLVGKTLEQGLMEVLEEDELAAIRAHREDYEQLRNAELAEVQRMEAEERRKAEEKSRRVQQQRERLGAQQAARSKAASAAFAKALLGGVRGRVVDRLHRTGHFYDPLVREIEEQFLPKVLERASGRVDQTSTARALVEDLLRDALALGRKQYADLVQQRREAEEARLAAEAEARQLAEEEAARKRAEEEAEAARKAAEEAEDGEEGEEGEEDEEDD